MIQPLPLARGMFKLQNGISFLDNNFSFERYDFSCIKTTFKKEHSFIYIFINEFTLYKLQIQISCLRSKIYGIKPVSN